MENYIESGITWIGKIPSEWKINKIKAMASLSGRIGWQGLTSEEYTDEGAYLITGVDFENGVINWDSCVHIPIKRWKEAVGVQIKENDLLITKDGTVGKVALAKNMPYETSLNSGVLLIRPDKEFDNPVKVTTIIVSQQTQPKVDRDFYTSFIIEECLKKVIPSWLVIEETKVLINPTGEFVKGGPYADSGLTGRKIICDTYGGVGRHGGGAFSGKDPTKVDRCAAYYARYVAKNVVAAGLARKCEVQVAYAIGVAKPVAVNIETFGTSKYTNDQIKEAVLKFFNFTPKAIRTEILNDDISYYDLAKYGHIGRSDIRVPWERTNKTYILKAYFKQKYAKRVR